MEVEGIGTGRGAHFGTPAACFSFLKKREKTEIKQ